MNKDLEGNMERLRGWMENKKEEVKMLMGGDFNARVGREGGRVREDEEEKKKKGGQRMGRLIGKEEKCVASWEI